MVSRWLLSVLRAAEKTSFLRQLPNKLTKESYQRVCFGGMRRWGAKGSRLMSERKQVLALSKYNMLDKDLAKQGKNRVEN